MRERIDIDIKVPNQTRYLSLIGKIGEDVARTIKRFDGDREKLAYNVNVVLTEAMANAILHANRDAPDPEVHVRISVFERVLTIEVFDQGQGFDIDALPAHNPDSCHESGRGIYIMRSLMDRISYKKSKNGYVLVMVKSLSA
ncbi:MAG: ATP-binding protein [Desulfuromonadaceae bacterium]|nr:ATP-binding protein [Desulfuromonadaceae bacterium]